MQIKHFFGCIYILLLSGSLAAQTGDAGRESLFSIGVGARGLGLGGASVACPEDASAFTWNPAGMRRVQQKSVLLSQTTLFEDVQYHFIGYVHPTMNAGVFGFGVSRIGVGGITGFDEVQGVSVETGTINYWWGKLSLAYARSLMGDLSFGLNFEANRQVMGSQYATNGFGLDVGLLYAVSQTRGFLNGFSLGVNYINAVNPKLKLGTSTETLPHVTRIGLAKEFSLRNGHDRWLLLYDADWMKYRKTHSHFGSEYSFDRTLFLRIGIDRGRPTFGGGLRYHGIQFDYATEEIGDPEFFNRSHLFSLSFYLGKSIPDKLEELRLAREREMEIQLEEKMEQDRQKRIRDGLKAGQDFLQRGDYFNARLEFNRVLREDKNNSRAQEFLRMTEQQERVKQQARQDSLLQQERVKVETQQNLEFVNTRLSEGNAAMQRGDFQQAIAKWREALAVDPENPTLRRYIQQAQNALEDLVNRAIARSRAYAQQDNLSEARNVLEQAKLQTAGNEPLENRVNQEIRRLAQMVDFAATMQAGLDRYNKGDYEAAVPFFKKALEAQPDNDRVLTLYRNAMARSARTENPVSEEVQKEVKNKINEGARLYVDGRYEEALQVWEDGLKLDPHNVNLLAAIESAKQKMQTFKKPK